MVSQFQRWRKSKEEKFANLNDLHYFRVSKTTWSSVRTVLQSLLVARVNLGESFLLTLPSERANDLLDFLEQMKWGYIHPRSTSHRVLMVREAQAAGLSI